MVNTNSDLEVSSPVNNVNCVLLVDDNKFTNIFNSRVLERINIVEKVVAVEDGQEALAYMKKAERFQGDNYPAPDIIFLDINMPVMDGWQFLEEFKPIRPRFNHAVIVVLTTSHDPNDREKALSNEEVDDYYIKPLSKDIVAEVIRKHC